MGFCRSLQDKNGKWNLTGTYSAMDGWGLHIKHCNQILNNPDSRQQNPSNL